jgi:LysR family transcriptional regulator, low CO2-responsive transcriptional regulator
MTLAKVATLKQLVAFHTVARLGSVSQAADELHLTQSAVSIQVASIEAAVGAPLLLRTGRGVRLTEAGELLDNYAERVLALWNEMGDGMASMLGAFSGTLRVGAVATSEYWLPSLLVAFANENPKVKLKLHTGNREEMVRSLAAQEIDVAVMGNPPDELKPTASSFAKNPMGFLAAPHHPLMSERKLTMARLAESNLLVRERGSGSRLTLMRLFREAGLHVRIGSELSSNEAIKQMCIAGFGPAYLSLHTCMLEMKAGLLALLPMPGNTVVREWYVVHSPTHPLPQVALAFEHFLQAQGQHRINGLLDAREALPGPALARRVSRAATSSAARAAALPPPAPPRSSTPTRAGRPRPRPTAR